MFTNKDRIKIFCEDDPYLFQKQINHYLETYLEDGTILTPIKIIHNPNGLGHEFIMICKKEPMVTIYDFNNIVIEE